MILVRNAETINQRQRKWGSDSSLTNFGIKQAAAIGNTLRGRMAPQFIVASDMRSADTTARVAMPGVPMVNDSIFNEIGFGEYDNKVITDSREFWDLHREEPWNVRRLTRADDVKFRAEYAIDRLSSYPDDTIVFTHYELLRAILSLTVHGNIYHMIDYNPCNCAVITIGREHFL